MGFTIQAESCQIALNDNCCERISGGGQQRSNSRALTPRRQRNEGNTSTRISGGFYQINIAMAFILGGNNNAITTVQGNSIGTLSFQAVALPSG